MQIIRYLAAATTTIPIALGIDSATRDDDTPYLRTAPQQVSHGAEQAAQQVADAHFASHVEYLGLTEPDVATKRVASTYASRHNGISHIFYTQTVNGIDVTNAATNINVDGNGKVIGKVRSSFVSKLEKKASFISNRPTITAADAVSCALNDYAAQHIQDEADGPPGSRRKRRLSQSEIEAPPELIASIGGPAQEATFQHPVSMDDIPAKLVYYKVDEVPGVVDTDIELVWELTVNTFDKQFWGSVWVKTSDCTVLDKINWITGASDGAQYEVFALPKESPSDGPRTIEVNPADALASPYGWHDVDGVEGPEYTYTRGNNVCAHTDRDDDDAGCGTENPPDGGPSLNFTGSLVELDLETQSPSEYQNAAVVNLFYWNNIMHDLLYQYGFDEASGNFQ